MKISFTKKINTNILVFILISFFGFIIYADTFDSPFIFDDYDGISHNRSIQLKTLSPTHLYQAAFTNPNKSRPVANLSFALNYYIHGLNVRGFHWVNLIIHIINGYLVFMLTLLTLRLNRNKNGKLEIKSTDSPLIICAWVAALIFICHPVQTQSVTYIIQRMNSMAAMFYFLALLMFIKGRLSVSIRKGFWFYAAALLTWIMALGSKQIAVTLPLIIILYEWYFFQGLNKDWIKRNTIYITGVVVLMTATAIIFLGENPIDRILHDYNYRSYSLGERLLTQFRVVTFYISLLFLPHPSRLNLLHDISISQSLFMPITTLLSILFLSCLFIYAVIMARNNRLISFCILWFFINLVIESSVIGLELIFEHRLYLPMFGFSIFTSYLLFKLLSGKRSLMSVSVIILIFSLATGAYARNKTWKDAKTLWADVVKKNHKSLRGHFNYGTALAKQGQLNQAIDQFNIALKLEPDFPQAKKVLAMTYYELGNVMINKGDIEDAKGHYINSIFLDPYFAEPYNNLGNVFIQQGNINGAFTQYSTAIRLNPHYYEFHVNLANVYALDENFEDACSHYQQALQLNPEQITVKNYFNKHCKQK